jgi:glutaminase
VAELYRAWPGCSKATTGFYSEPAETVDLYTRQSCLNLGTFAPPLDAAGNSVKGQLAATFLSRRLGLDLFGSVPDA